MAGTFYMIECFKRVQQMVDLEDRLDVIIHPALGILAEKYDIRVDDEKVISTSDIFFVEAYISGFLKGIAN
ncbi:hypothetical protein VPHD51_0032 [Vibrio phage D51]